MKNGRGSITGSTKHSLLKCTKDKLPTCGVKFAESMGQGSAALKTTARYSTIATVSWVPSY